jgi:hypothetical protein
MGQVKQAMLDERTGRPYGDHGTHNQALEYMLHVMEADPANQVEFIRAWSYGDLEEWPEFYEWLEDQEQ